MGRTSNVQLSTSKFELIRMGEILGRASCIGAGIFPYVKLYPLPLLVLAASAFAQDAPSFPAPKSLGDVSSYGRNIQRTMRLLATSTPEKKNTVRILFYGQSITEQAWWKIVADDLKKRFPNANLVIENRAIGGHSSQLLVKTAEADLYPFQPDLLIFHVYGSHVEYESIIKSVRERTTAEILLQNDHVTKPENLTEETDPAKLNPGNWDPFISYQFLPSIAKKYQAEFVDQRAIWKQYLADHKLAPSALLSDSVHLSPQGEFLMAEAVKAYLRYDPKLAPSPAEEWVKTIVVGKDVSWKDGKLTIPFSGSRVDLIAGPTGGGPVSLTIDGKKPSELPGPYDFTRTTAYPQSNWPCLLRVQAGKSLQAEEWTLTLKNVGGDVKAIQFELVGSKTGADGAGEVGQNFVSKSGRIVIEPGDWNLDYCVKVFGQRLKEGFEVKWQVKPAFVDNLVVRATGAAGTESAQTVVQGLPNGKHVLEITGAATTPISAVRIYTPALN